MLLEFSVKNYLSFKDEVTLSLRGRESVTGHEGDNTFDVAGEPILKSAVIYGANASGKSNLIKAMQFMKHFVLNSAIRLPYKNEIAVNRFLLNYDSFRNYSYFEVVFVYKDYYYRYGFKLDVSKIHQEWLYYAPVDSEQEECLFVRKCQTIEFNQSFDELKSFVQFRADGTFELLKSVRETALLSSVIARFNGKTSLELIHWFENEFSILFASEDKIFRKFTEEELKDGKFKEKIVHFLKVADVGIEDVDIDPEAHVELHNNSIRQLNLFKEEDYEFCRIITSHKIYDYPNSKYIVTIGWDMDACESEGTRKLFALSAPIIDALEHGKTLVIDELDS